jgi:glycosyltransferase involved in cell wall biosynthesis
MRALERDPGAGNNPMSVRRLAPVASAPVVIFTNSFMMGGMEAHIESLATGLVARGVPTAVICPSDPVIAPMREALASARVNVHTLSPSQRSPLALLRRVRHLQDVVRTYAPCIFHIHNTGSDGGALPMLAARLGGARWLVRTEHQPPDYPVSIRQRILIRARDRALDRVICVSQANLRQHVRDLRRDGQKFVSIANGVDLSAFHPERADRRPVRDLAGAGDGTILVGMLGRLAEPRKGAEFFVDMARMLHAERDDCRFVVVGEGPRRSALLERAGGAVTFLGRHPDAASCYAAMDVVVVPSLWEGGPITVLEAMAMGRVVVTTDVGMVREVITDGVNGRIVPPGDAEALAMAVRALADDRGSADGMAALGRQTIEDGFASELMVDRVAALYRELSG